MPYAAPIFNDDPNDPKKNGQDPTNISGGQSANFSTGIPGQETAGDKNQKSSGNYANIQSYLDANKDQADQMGQTIASNVDQTASTAKDQIGALDAKAPKVEAYDPNEIYNNVTNLTDAQKAAYRDERTTGGYTGPQTIDAVDGYADAQKAATDASTKVKNAGTETGQQQLLKDTYARPQYSAGENRLDQVLLQNSAGSKQALENVSSKYSDLDSLFTNASTNVGNSINAANTQALANKQNILTAEQQQYQNLLNPIQARADQANAQNPVLADQIGSQLRSGTLTEDTLQKLGLTAGTKLYNQDLSSYYNTNGTQVGINNVATADERSKYQALSDLIQDPTRAELTADGAAINPYTFDLAKFQADNASKAAEMQKILDAQHITGKYSGANTVNLNNNSNTFAGGNLSTAAANYGRIDATPTMASTDLDIGSYLRDGSLSNSTQGLGTSADFDKALAGSKADALKQLEDFLNSQQYYRTIQKG